MIYQDAEEKRNVKMRDEKTMFRLFEEIAEADDRILAVYMNGSRTNRNAVKDIFQDYDIVYVVKETAPFIAEDRAWFGKFGEVLYMQYPDAYPEEYPDEENAPENSYGWLMQFTDGNRVDLTVQSVEYAAAHIREDGLCKILLDKRHILPELPEATDEARHVKKPTERSFRHCCNEFWWCSNNLAKGLWRNEMPYVQDMANMVVRKQLEKLLSWKAGIRTDFTVSVGKSGKYLYRWLEPEEYRRYLKTYFGGDVREAWEAVFLMCDMVDSVGREIAQTLGFSYDEEEAAAARSFLERVRELPADAEEIF